MQNNMVQSVTFKNCESKHWLELLQVDQLSFPETSKNVQNL